jgi:hypothetical protein
MHRNLTLAPKHHITNNEVKACMHAQSESNTERRTSWLLDTHTYHTDRQVQNKIKKKSIKLWTRCHVEPLVRACTWAICLLISQTGIFPIKFDNIDLERVHFFEFLFLGGCNSSWWSSGKKNQIWCTTNMRLWTPSATTCLLAVDSFLGLGRSLARHINENSQKIFQLDNKTCFCSLSLSLAHRMHLRRNNA